MGVVSVANAAPPGGPRAIIAVMFNPDVDGSHVPLLSLPCLSSRMHVSVLRWLLFFCCTIIDVTVLNITIIVIIISCYCYSRKMSSTQHIKASMLPAKLLT